MGPEEFSVSPQLREITNALLENSLASLRDGCEPLMPVLHAGCQLHVFDVEPWERAVAAARARAAVYRVKKERWVLAYSGNIRLRGSGERTPAVLLEACDPDGPVLLFVQSYRPADPAGGFALIGELRLSGELLLPEYAAAVASGHAQGRPHPAPGPGHPANAIQEAVGGLLGDYGPPERRMLDMGVDAELFAFVRGIIEQAVCRLHASAEEDACADLNRLEDHARRELERGSTDELWRWCLFAARAVHCSNDFGVQEIEPLVARDIRNLRWPVAQACWVILATGSPRAAENLRSWIKGLGRRSLLRGFRSRIPDFDLRLQELAADPDPGMRRAALLARALSDGAPLGEALDALRRPGGP